MNHRDVINLLVGFGVGGVILFNLHILGVIESRTEKSLESRIARQDSLLQHHIKKAAFDSTNQANQKRVK